MALAGEQALGGYPREVSDVLREQRTILRNCGRKDLWIGAASQSKLENGGRVHAGSPQRLGVDGRVHLVEEQPQCFSEAEVSRR